jgi:hypothetical protein
MLLFAMFVCIGLYGCAGVAMLPTVMAYAPTIASAGVQSSRASSMATSSTDADTATMELATPTTSDAFAEKVRTVVRDLGYQLNSNDSFGAGERIITAVKTKRETGFIPFVGLNALKSTETSTVTVRLGSDGRTVQISARTSASGTNVEIAKEVAERFKTGLLNLYVSK